MSYRSSNTPRFGTPLKLGITLLILLMPFAAAQAYVGPGAGLSLLSALWGLLCAIGAAFLFVILWPIRRMRRKRRESQQAREQHATAASADKPASEQSRDSHRG
ncbi:hypothetical protein [Salinisphaera hydrothermalis]|uniref:Uncharacterized protein n=1 Tax=Salinisphaera hydrothermalis (strain C41B8) TaxID=1304275 RepID=A0A084IGY4_SALHC|nr:hypothetical protein [Salinisphaera hydrothermalis]KEZ75968.1 hypothetical protein C41B8_17361 [Salinisphaera hydrothermalis C41B8]